MYMNEQELLRLEEVSVTNENDSAPCGCVASPARGAEGQGGGRPCPHRSSWLSQAHCVLAPP